MACCAKSCASCCAVYVAEDRKLATVLEETNSKFGEITELELGIVEDLGKREEAARAATQEARSLEDELTTARAARLPKRCCDAIDKHASVSTNEIN